MKLSVIALDYDGTIARDGILDSSVRAAIADARRCGITVLLVTGRILADLRRVAGDLHFADGIVAENGAILHSPHSGFTSTLASPVPEAFVAELRRRGIPYGHGRCLVEADAREATRLLDVIRALELPLVLIFNGSRVMVLPQGVSKATGLRAALDTFRLPARNTLAIGDAENDHELLRLAEIGVAVEWGSPALQSTADIVLPGAGPSAVGSFVQSLADNASLPVPRRQRRRLVLGSTENGSEFSLALGGRNVVIAGEPRSGKSSVAGLLCERLILHGYSVCVIDPEGGHRSLEAWAGVSVLGGDDPLPTASDLLRALRPDHSVVIDLSRRPQDDTIEYVRALLPTLNEIRRQTGLPHRIVADQAHYFLDESDARDLLDLKENGYIIATCRASRLPKELLAATEVMVVTRESNRMEVDALRQWCSKWDQTDRARWSLLAHLRPGEAVALPAEDTGGDLRVFAIASRMTPHARTEASEAARVSELVHAVTSKTRRWAATRTF